MRLNLLSLCAAAGLSLLSASAVNAQGFIHAKGKEIVDGQDRPLLLRGMGLGGWMLQEGYMLKLSKLGPQHVIKARISDLIGPEKTETFYAAWRANHTTKADIDYMAEAGFNSVRLPMHWNLFMRDGDAVVWREDGFRMVDALLAWCKQNGMVLILDLHAAPGGQGNDLAISDRDPDQPSLWQSPAEQAKMIALWRELARRYKDEPAIAAYDILNEPNWGFQDAADKNGCKETANAPLRDLYVRTIAAIREEDKNHLIFIEGNCWGNNYTGILPIDDANLALSFHKYWNNTTQDIIQPYLDLRDQYGLPLWNGESGENSNDWFARSIRLQEDNNIGWAWWPLKKIGFNNPLQVEANPGYMNLVAYLTADGPRPTAAEAEAALMQLATHDVRFENNTRHPDVTDALFRGAHSDAPVPYKAHVIGATGGVIQAADYDMGKDGFAYHDTLSGNYYVSTGGPRTVGNTGTTYRNDGVDIARDASGRPYVQMEAGEWLHFTVTAEKTGNYAVALPAGFSVTVNGDAADARALPLVAGRNVLIITAKAAGDLTALTFTPAK